MSRNMEQVQVSDVGRPTGAQAIDRAACLLRQVVDAPEPVTFTELTTTSGLAKSTTSRILLALERNGLVRREPSGAFKPGEAFIQYAATREHRERPCRRRPSLSREVGRRHRETINLGVIHGSMVEQVRASRQPVRARRHQLAWALRAFVLHGARQGAPRLRSRRASAWAPLATDLAHDHQAVRARSRSLRGPPSAVGLSQTRSSKQGSWPWPPPSTRAGVWR